MLQEAELYLSTGSATAAPSPATATSHAPRILSWNYN